MRCMQVGKKQILMLACSIDQLWWGRDCKENILYKLKLDKLLNPTIKMLLIIHPHSAKTCMCFSLLWNTKENIFGMLFGLKNHFLCSTEDRKNRFGVISEWWQNFYFWVNISFKWNKKQLTPECHHAWLQ